MTDYAIVEEHPGCPDNRNVAVVGEDDKVLGCHWNPSRAQQQIDMLKKRDGEDPYDGKPWPPPRVEGEKRSAMLDARPADPEALAVEGGLDPDDLHVTLHYLGDDDTVYHEASRTAICEALCDIARNTPPFDAKVCGTGYLGEDQDMVAFLESQELNDIRDELKERLAGVIPESNYPNFIPHMTLGRNTYLEDTPGVGNWYNRPVHITAMGAKYGSAKDYHSLEGDTGEHVDPPIKSGSQDDKEIPVDYPDEEGRSKSEQPVIVPPTSFRGGDGMSDMKYDKRNLPEEVVKRLVDHDAHFGIVDRAGRALEHVCFTPEIREDTDAGTVTFLGYATRYDFPYDVGGGPEQYGWRETMRAGSCDRSVAEQDDVRLLFNHGGIPLARTRAKTLTLESDSLGLRCEASLDMESPTARSVVSAMRRGDLSDMSMGFQVLRDEWNTDYTERSISEIRLFDVSVVGYPANPAAVAMIRDERHLGGETREAEASDGEVVDTAEEPEVRAEGESAEVVDGDLNLTPGEPGEPEAEAHGISLAYAKALRSRIDG